MEKIVGPYTMGKQRCTVLHSGYKAVGCGCMDVAMYGSVVV